LPTPSEALVLASLCAGVGTGAAIDAARRRIPNGVSLATAATGVTLAATGLSGVSLASSLLGFLIGFVMMLPGHILGATGAGDVKLFAAAGALLGAARIVPAFFFVAIAGGIFALAVAWRRGRLVRTMHNTARLCGNPIETKVAIESKGEHNRFPYGPAIAVGCILAALL
jgi:prepilin peptidase CpaA